MFVRLVMPLALCDLFLIIFENSFLAICGCVPLDFGCELVQRI